MASIKSIQYAELGNVEYATITKDNGASIYARVIRRTDDELLILFAGKLISISLPDFSNVKVLCEGVSIR
jgi:hypothetical protein